MKTLTQVTKETIGYENLDPNDRYAKHRLVMTIAARLKRIYKFDGVEMTVTLKDIWKAFKSYLKSLIEVPSVVTAMPQPNLSEYYLNKHYTGD